MSGRKYYPIFQTDTVIRLFGVGVDYAGTLRSFVRKAAVVLATVCLFFVTLASMRQLESERLFSPDISDEASVGLIYAFFAIVLIPLYSLFAEHMNDYGGSIVALVLLFPTTFWALYLIVVITRHLPLGFNGTSVIVGSMFGVAIVYCVQVVCLAAHYGILRRAVTEPFSEVDEDEHISIFEL